MEKVPAPQQKILIVDDSELNRLLLSEVLGGEFELLEAKNGLHAISMLQKLTTEIDLVLLDLIMPELDGYGVLSVMSQNHWIEDIPVIVLSSDDSPDTVERAYSLGASDFILRPFDAQMVRHRVLTTISMYTKQRHLLSLVTDQIYERQKSNDLMIEILSHIVEFRNGESGQHVLHIQSIVETLLLQLARKTDLYALTYSDITRISTAAALHDIGKIGIPLDILNKPGQLTPEEWAIMQTHAEIGASMLQDLACYRNDPLVKVAYEICRWHHERYDGNGYPDHLVGDAIPISAQAVSLADAYDALTSSRVYKPPFSHEEALELILSGGCGAFHPQLLECLKETADLIRDQTAPGQDLCFRRREIQTVTEALIRNEELASADHALQQLRHAQTKYQFFTSVTQEIQFEYTLTPPMITFSQWGAKVLGLKEVIMDPQQNLDFLSVVGADNFHNLSAALRHTTPDQPNICFEGQVQCSGSPRWFRYTCRAIWSSGKSPRYLGMVGKMEDIHELVDLQHMVSYDALTGLLNHTYAKKRIQKALADHPEEDFAMMIFDLDHFKQANDLHGHMFGDKVLKHVAANLRQCIRAEDIAARAGGDEFLVFLRYHGSPEPIVQKIFQALSGEFSTFPISLSMGIARTEAVGRDYDTLFHCADQALYASKRGGRGRYRFYDDSLAGMFSTLSPIESAPPDGQDPE